MKAEKNILVLWARNSARRRMTISFPRKYAGGRFVIWSARLRDAEVGRVGVRR